MGDAERRPRPSYEEWQAAARDKVYQAIVRVNDLEHELVEARRALTAAKSHPACVSYDVWAAEQFGRRQ